MIIDNLNQNGFVVSTITEAEASVRNAEQLREAIAGMVEEGQKKIVLNFERVTYIDSSFLGSMVAGLKYAISKGADIYLVNLRADIYDLLCLIRMNKVFKIFGSMDEVIKNLQ